MGNDKSAELIMQEGVDKNISNIIMQLRKKKLNYTILHTHTHNKACCTLEVKHSVVQIICVCVKADNICYNI